jgi:hypothetical protein
VRRDLAQGVDSLELVRCVGIATKLATARVIPLVVKAICLVEVAELRALVDDLLGLIGEARALQTTFLAADTPDTDAGE